MRKIDLFILSFCILFSEAVTAQIKEADLLHASLDITLEPNEGRVYGEVVYKVYFPYKVDSLVIDARAIRIDKVLLQHKNVRYSYNERFLRIYKPPGVKDTAEIAITFSAKPDRAMYFERRRTNRALSSEGGFLNDTLSSVQIWTQGQGKNHSNWFPSKDEQRDKMTFSLSIHAPETMEVAATGDFVGQRQVGRQVRWSFEQRKPISTYLLAITAGSYVIHKDVYQGLPIQAYTYPEDTVSGAFMLQSARSILQTFENEFGVAYPFEAYSMVPAHDFVVAGMENVTLNIFSDQWLPLGPQERIIFFSINAHELAHQWFGNLVTESASTEHWLHEGFATWFSWVAEKNYKGSHLFEQRLLESYLQLKEQQKRGEGMSLLNSKANALTFYEKGAWAVLAFKREVGPQHFRDILREFLTSFAYKSVTINDLFALAEKRGWNSSEFKRKWLESDQLPSEDMEAVLQEYSGLRTWLRWNQNQQPTKEKDIFLQEQKEWLLKSDWREVPEYLLLDALGKCTQVTDTTFRKVIVAKGMSHPTSFVMASSLNYMGNDLTSSMSDRLLQIFKDGNTEIRQSFFQWSWQNQPSLFGRFMQECKKSYESLDSSTKMLFLYLTEVTSYDFLTIDSRLQFTQFTATDQPYYVRQEGFFYLEQLNWFEEDSLRSLLEGCVHQVIPFRDACRALFQRLLKNPVYFEMVEKWSEDLTERQRELLRDWLQQEE